MQFIDTHCHLNFPKLLDNLPQILDDAKVKNVTQMITVGCDKSSSQTALDLAQNHENIHATIGFHPAVEDDFDSDFIEKTIPKAVALGEIGLDFFYDTDREHQEKIFRTQLQIAQKYNKPVILHARDAEAETLQILTEYKIKKAVFHCYTGNSKTAQDIIDAGHLISFTGIITYPKADNIREIIKNLPLDRIMLETDAPYLAPQSKRGQTCTPTDVIEIAKTIAKIKNISLEEVANQTTKNAIDFFEIKV